MRESNLQIKSESYSPLIFVVDDDVKVLLLMSHILSQTTYKYHCVSSAEAALKWLKSFSPDVILMEINLPGKDGFGILEDIKNYDNLNKSITVAFTTFSQPGDEERFIKAGYDYYFAKPFSHGDVLAFIQQVAERQIVDTESN